MSKFKIVGKDEFAYNSRTDGRDMLVLALNRDNENIIVTFNYNAFRIKASVKDLINVEYLYAYFKRSEFDRRVRFDSWGSSQELLSWEACAILLYHYRISRCKTLLRKLIVYLLIEKKSMKNSKHK